MTLSWISWCDESLTVLRGGHKKVTKSTEASETDKVRQTKTSGEVETLRCENCSTRGALPKHIVSKHFQKEKKHENAGPPKRAVFLFHFC